jgi:hypothetical protein
MPAGTQPFWTLRERRDLAGTMGEYEGPGVGERAYEPFEYGQRHRAALGADPIVSYDLGAPGRVREIKGALKRLGQAGATPGIIPWSEQELIKESLWAQLVDDDTWSDVAADEFVAFLSRWAPRYMCFAFPLFGVVNGLAQPTTNGLLLLDVALRYEAANLLQRGIAALQACGYGGPSSARLGLFEDALLGAAAEVGAGVDLNPSVRNSVSVVPTINVALHPVAPPDGDSTLYSKWKAAERELDALYATLAKATNESTRSDVLARLEMKRIERDQTAREIIAKMPKRQGSTTVTCGGPNDVFDEALERCVPKPVPPKAASAGWFVVAGVGLALGAALFTGAPVKHAKRHR